MAISTSIGLANGQNHLFQLFYEGLVPFWVSGLQTHTLERGMITSVLVDSGWWIVDGALEVSLEAIFTDFMCWGKI